MHALNAILLCGGASAFHVMPARTSMVRRTVEPVMMPKFLKDLFPGLEKPDDPLGSIKSFFGLGEESSAGLTSTYTCKRLKRWTSASSAFLLHD